MMFVYISIYAALQLYELYMYKDIQNIFGLYNALSGFLHII